MRTAIPTILAITLSACDDDDGTRFPESPDSPRIDVAGTLERVDPDGVDWLGVEVVDLTTADGACGLTREIVAVEEGTPCAGCGLTLAEVTTTVVDQSGDCDVDLEQDVPTVGPSLAFRTGDDWLLPARGEVLVGAGDAWEPYSSGLLEVGALSYQHRTRLGGPGAHDGDVRDLPDKPVTR